jgi:hypothetical protein
MPDFLKHAADEDNNNTDWCHSTRDHEANNECLKHKLYREAYNELEALKITNKSCKHSRTMAVLAKLETGLDDDLQLYARVILLDFRPSTEMNDTMNEELVRKAAAKRKDQS